MDIFSKPLFVIFNSKPFFAKFTIATNCYHRFHFSQFFMFAMFRATSGRPGRREWVEMVANRCNWRKENEKYPMISKSLGNHGVLAVLATKGTGNPSPTSKKRDSLSTVSLVREAGLEGFSHPLTFDPSTNQNQYFIPFYRPLTDLILSQAFRFSAITLMHLPGFPEPSLMCNLKGFDLAI